MVPSGNVYSTTFSFQHVNGNDSWSWVVVLQSLLVPGLQEFSTGSPLHVESDETCHPHVDAVGEKKSPVIPLFHVLLNLSRAILNGLALPEPLSEAISLASH